MKKSSIFCVVSAVLLSFGCAKDNSLQEVPETALPSAVRDGYFQTKVTSSGNEDLDKLMRSLYFFKTQPLPLSVTLTGRDKDDHIVKADFKENSQVEIRFNIYPIHSFSSAGVGADEGDYYFVEQVTSLCSNLAYTRKGKNITLGRDQAKCTGFYLKGLSVSAILCDASGNQVGTFRQTPVPVTSTGSTTHTTGFDCSLSGGFSGIISGIPMLNGTIGYHKSSAAEISDLTVSNTHDSKGTVEYAYTVHNLPGKSNSSVPAVATNTLDLPAAWIWFVPRASGNQEYTVKMSLSNIVYRTHLLWGSYFESYDTKGAQIDFSFNIPAPLRVATGTIIVKNNSTDSYFTNPEIKNVATGATVSDTTNGAYGPGQQFTAVIPEGTYSVSFISGGERKTLRKQYTLNMSESVSVQAYAFD